MSRKKAEQAEDPESPGLRASALPCHAECGFEDSILLANRIRLLRNEEAHTLCLGSGVTPAPSAQAKTRKKIVETEKKTQASKSSDTVRTDTRSSSGSAAVPVVLWRLEPSCMMFSAMAWTSQCFPTGNPGDPAAQRKAAPREGGLRGRHFRLRESPCNLRVLETLTSVLSIFIRSSCAFLFNAAFATCPKAHKEALESALASAERAVVSWPKAVSLPWPRNFVPSRWWWLLACLRPHKP